MSETTAGWPGGCPTHLGAVLRHCAEGACPPTIGLMHLIMASSAAGEVDAALAAALAGAAAVPDAAARARIEAVRDLWRSQPQAWRIVKAMQNGVPHDDREAPAAKDPVTRWAAIFDRAAAISPEASVALYSLGDPALLAAATEEVVQAMRAWGLVGRGRRLAEIGCGIGRFARALADEAVDFIGLDISATMVAQARRRCAGLAGIRFVQSSGRDLSALRDGTIDTLFAVDAFPYITAAGQDVAERHFAEARRVLRTGGDFLILNFSYRGDEAADRRDVARLAEAHGLAVVRAGTRDFACWDGATFHLRRG